MRAGTGSGNQQGIALVMVLMVVVVLAALAGTFAYSMKVETKLARNAAWETELEWLGRSGIELGKYALSQRAGVGGAFDSLGQAWAGGRMDTNETVQRLIGQPQPLGNGQILVTIEDMDRRLNINACNTPSPEGDAILRQALTIVGVDASVTPTVVNSILDWMDPDKASKPGGAESEFYNGLIPAYKAKDGAIDDITELLWINGVRDSPGIFWGSGAPPSHRQPKSARQSHFEEPVYAVGLRDIFCAVSGGRLNINTATPNALQVIPFIDEGIAQAILQRRAGPDGLDGSEDDTPFRNPQEILSLPGVDQARAAAFTRFLTVQSAVFQIRVEARIGVHSRTYVGYIRRGGQTFPILNLIWEDS